MFVRALDGRRRHDLAAPLRGRTEYSVETDDVRARRRHERREAAKQLDRLQLQLLAAVGERALHSDREAPIWQLGKPILRQRRPRAVAAQPSQPLPIVGVQVDTGVQREAFEVGGVLLRDRGVGWLAEKGGHRVRLGVGERDPDAAPARAVLFLGADLKHATTPQAIPSAPRAYENAPADPGSGTPPGKQPGRTRNVETHMNERASTSSQGVGSRMGRAV